MNYSEALKTFQTNKAENNKSYEAFGAFLKTLTACSGETYYFSRKDKTVTLMHRDDSCAKIVGMLEFAVDSKDSQLTAQEKFEEERRQRLFLDHWECRLNNVYEQSPHSKRFTIPSDQTIETKTYCRYNILRQNGPDSYQPFATFTFEDKDFLKYRLPLYRALCDLSHAMNLLSPLKPPSGRPSAKPGEPSP